MYCRSHFCWGSNPQGTPPLGSDQILRGNCVVVCGLLSRARMNNVAHWNGKMNDASQCGPHVNATNSTFDEKVAPETILENEMSKMTGVHPFLGSFPR